MEMHSVAGMLLFLACPCHAEQESNTVQGRAKGFGRVKMHLEPEQVPHVTQRTMAAAQAAGVSTSPEHLTPLPRQSDQNGQLNPLRETGHAELTRLGTDGGKSEHKGELVRPCRVCMWCLQVGHALSRPKGSQKNMMDIKHGKERDSYSFP